MASLGEQSTDGTVGQWVYVGVRGDRLKVGTSTNPQARARDLRLRLLTVLPGDHRLERSFHDLLDHAALGHEWFRADECDYFVEWVAGYAQMLEDSGEVPPIPDPRLHDLRPKRAKKGRKLGHRWRLHAEPGPITVRQVPPAPRMPVEQAEQIRTGARLARFGPTS